MLRRASVFKDFAGINHVHGDGSIGDISPSSDNEEGLAIRLYEERYGIPLSIQSDRLLSHIVTHLSGTFPPDAIPLRFAATRTCKDHIDCEVGVLTGLVHDHRRARGQFWIFVPGRMRTARASTVLVVRTGIDADIGGRAGDADQSPVCSRLRATG